MEVSAGVFESERERIETSRSSGSASVPAKTEPDQGRTMHHNHAQLDAVIAPRSNDRKLVSYLDTPLRTGDA